MSHNEMTEEEEQELREAGMRVATAILFTIITTIALVIAIGTLSFINCAILPG